MVTTANNMLLYTWELLRTNLKYSLHKKRDLAVWADGYVNFLEPGNLSTVYMYVKSSHYTLNIYDYICQLFLNKVGGKKITQQTTTSMGLNLHLNSYNWRDLQFHQYLEILRNHGKM